jgi:cell division protein FtsQ
MQIDMWKKWLQISLWSLLGVGTCTLLVAAMQKKDEKACPGIEISIDGAKDNVFIDDKDVMEIMKTNGAVKGKEVSEINLRNIEEQLEKNAWIKDADLFFDNNQVLHAKIEEREPIARIFTLSGKSYYIDSSCKMLPLSDERSARVPMFTSFPSDKKILSKPDSLVLQDVKRVAQYINADSFLTAQVAQIDITSQGTYEIIPVLGDQLIRIGDAEGLDEKFGKLKSFYKQVWAKTGFEKYETIDVQYKDQVVATKRGAGKIYADTTKAMKEFGNTLQQIKSVLNDTAFAAEVVKPLSAKDSVATKKIETKTNSKTVKKNISPAINQKQPKAVMKKH